MFESVTVLPKPPKSAGILVVGHFEGQDLDAPARKLDVGGAAAAACQRSEATGRVGTVLDAFSPTKGKGPGERTLVVGLGPKDTFTVGVLRDVAAAVGRRLCSARATGARIELSGALHAVKVDLRAAGKAFGEGLGLVGWTCDEFKGRDKPKEKRVAFSAHASDGPFNDGMTTGVAIAQGANFARTLSQTPPNVATPAWMAEQARTLASQTGLSVSVFQGSDLERERFAGLINVGKASENKPCMIRLEYNPGGKGSKAKSGEKPLVLIGKTMTYDTGGLSLKINNGMVGMKRDKDGGCAVLGAMHAIATVIKPKRPVVALLAAAENSISDEAYRPDDVITFRNGVTVEITNTDAEGRLVLADALCWACEKENPSAIIDLATLTGGMVVALGSTFAGYFCEYAELRERLERASAESGERLWRMPMHQEYRDMMKSPIADILNSHPARKASPIQGAAFLDAFVDPKIPWAHIDIAGVHAVEKVTGPFCEGPTGWGARLLAAYLSQDAT